MVTNGEAAPSCGVPATTTTRITIRVAYIPKDTQYLVLPVRIAATKNPSQPRNPHERTGGRIHQEFSTRHCVLASFSSGVVGRGPTGVGGLGAG
jgi:hypothetical protein